MSQIEPPEPLEAFPFPEEAVVLPEASDRFQPSSGASKARDARALAVQALQQALRQRCLELPLGPQAVEDDPDRLLILNRFAVQLVDAGWLADELAVSMRHWQEPAGAPQLLLAALVDDENTVVHFPGVITAKDWRQLGADAVPATSDAVPTSAADPQAPDLRHLSVDAFHGGLERLLVLVQLLEPQALPFLSAQASTAADLARRVLQVRDWVLGRLDPALAALGAVLEPPIVAGAPGRLRAAEDNLGLGIDLSDAVESLSEMNDVEVFAAGIAFGAAAFASPLRRRARVADQVARQALAVLMIPLGIGPAGQLLSGAEASQCVERFKLLFMPSGASQPVVLLLRLLSSVPDDLLPEGLTLSVTQGPKQQRLMAEGSQCLDVLLPASADLIQVCLRYPGSPDLELPPLQLPRP